MKKFLILISISILAGVSSCKDEGSLVMCYAPDSLSGESVNLTITDGTDPFSPTGMADLVFADDSDSYLIIGDGTNVDNSFGTYSYIEKCNIGTLEFLSNSSGLTGAITTFNFDTSSSGSYTTELSGATQAGTFQR